MKHDVYVVMAIDAPMNPETAYWAHSNAGGGGGTVQGLLPDSAVMFRSGWNLVGTTGDVAHLAIDGVRIWRWSINEQAPRQLPADIGLSSGQTYMVFCPQAAEADLGVPEAAQP